jgi:HTH-type transcriptional regulator/antitoxin HigA
MERGLEMLQLQNIANVWPTIRNIFSVPHTENDYENLVSLLDELIDDGDNWQSVRDL